MDYLEWLILILVYFAAYGLWSAFDTYRERAPYRSQRLRRRVRRAVKFAVLAFVVVGLGVLYNSNAVQTLQTEPGETPTQETVSGVQAPNETQDVQSVGEKPETAEAFQDFLAASPEQEVALSSPPLITSNAPASTQSVAAAPANAPNVVKNSPRPIESPEKPEPFTVKFQSDPPGATLYLGNERVGVTPIELSLAGDEPLPYTLRTEEGVANYRLYHPYSGTLELNRDTSLSVWLERLSSEEVAALRSAALTQSAQPTLRHVSANTMRYQIATDCDEGLNLTYTDKTQRVVQEAGRKDGWAYGFIPRPGQLLYLYAKNNCDAGSLTLRFVQNDEVLEENTATGRDASATLSMYW